MSLPAFGHGDQEAEDLHGPLVVSHCLGVVGGSPARDREGVPIFDAPEHAVQRPQLRVQHGLYGDPVLRGAAEHLQVVNADPGAPGVEALVCQEEAGLQELGLGE